MGQSRHKAVGSHEINPRPGLPVSAFRTIRLGQKHKKHRLSSPGFCGGSVRPVSSVRWRAVGVENDFRFDGWDMSELAVESSLVEPIEVFSDGDLEVVNTKPGTAVADEFGFEQGVQRLRHRVVVAVTLGAHGRDGFGLSEAFGVAHGPILHTSIGVKPNSA